MATRCLLAVSVFEKRLMPLGLCRWLTLSASLWPEMIGNYGNFINNNHMSRQCLLLVADLKSLITGGLQGLLDTMQGQMDWEVWHKTV